MNENSTLHSAALTEAGAPLFASLSAFSNFYLSGGTALALHIGHRVSVDFDLFSPDPIAEQLLIQAKEVFSPSIRVAVTNADELTIFVHEVKVTFLHYPFPVIHSLVSYNKLKLLDVPEIAATKAYTIGRRGAYKDYIDLYYILSHAHTTLPTLIQLANKKYGDEFNDRLFLEQLVYLSDIKETPIEFLQQPVVKDQLEDFLVKQVRALEL